MPEAPIEKECKTNGSIVVSCIARPFRGSRVGNSTVSNFSNLKMCGNLIGGYHIVHCPNIIVLRDEARESGICLSM